MKCKRLAVLWRYLEPARIDFHAPNVAPVYIWNGATLVPKPVINKAIQRKGLRYVISVLTAILIKRQLALGIGNVESFRQLDRKHMPTGIWFFQNAMGSPKTRSSMPVGRKCAAAESP